MPKFIDVGYKVTTPEGQDALNITPELVRQRIFENARPLAQRMSEAYQNNLKLQVVRVGAVATGKTLRSIREELVLESPSRDLIMRRVTASRSIIFIQGGRKPGKAPMRFVGVGPKGGKIFEPLPAMVEWFVALNIPRAAWNWICILIGRRGIKPREVQVKAVKASERAWQEAIQNFGIRLADSLFKK